MNKLYYTWRSNELILNSQSFILYFFKYNFRFDYANRKSGVCLFDTHNLLYLKLTFIPVWRRMWVSRYPGVEKNFPHILQGWVLPLLFVWSFSCCLRRCSFWKSFPQTLQLKDFPRLSIFGLSSGTGNPETMLKI